MKKFVLTVFALLLCVTLAACGKPADATYAAYKYDVVDGGLRLVVCEVVYKGGAEASHSYKEWKGTIVQEPDYTGTVKDQVKWEEVTATESDFHKAVYAKAQANAKDGIVEAITTLSDGVAMASAKWDGKKFSNVKLNANQLNYGDNLSWKTSKYELKEAYNMKGASPIGKEWYEQADFLAMTFQTKGLEGLTKKGYAFNMTGATINDSGITTVFGMLNKYVGK